MSDDLVIEAIALVAATAVRAEHGSVPLQGVYSHPRTLLEISEADLPALVVYCRAQQDLVGASGRAVEQLDVVFEYLLPSAAITNERAQSWPALRQVWRTIVAAMRNGGHWTLQDGVDVLELAEVSVQPASGRATFLLEKGGREIDDGFNRFPLLRGQMLFDHYPSEVDASELYKFLSVHATFTQQSATAATPSLPGTSTGEGPVETNLTGNPSGLDEPT